MNPLPTCSVMAALIVAATTVVAEPGQPDWSEELRTYLERAADALDVPGGVVVVIANGETTVLTEGFACIDEPAPVTPDTSFGIGSLTKAFTATAAASLVAEGLLDWDTRARTLITDLELADPVAAQRVTLRDLLAHRSGFASHDIVVFNVDEPQAWILPHLARLEPLHEFRDRFAYSGLGYVLAGEMIGRAASLSWETVVSGRLLEPIGMDSTTFGAPVGPPDSAACGHRRWQGRMARVKPVSLTAGAPGNALYSTGEDIARWLVFLLGSGAIDGRRVVDGETLAETLAPQVIVRTGSSELRAYGLGWYLSHWHGRTVRWHQGGGLGFTSQIRLFPADGVAIAVLCNRMASGLPDLVATRAAELVLGEPHEDLLDVAVRMNRRIDAMRTAAAESIRSTRDPTAPPTLDLEAYAGCYVNPTLGTLEVTMHRDTLSATFHDVALPTEHLHDDLFVMSSIYTDDIVAVFSVSGDAALSVTLPLDSPPPGDVFTRKSGACTNSPLDPP